MLSDRGQNAALLNYILELDTQLRKHERLGRGCPPIGTPAKMLESSCPQIKPLRLAPVFYVEELQNWPRIGDLFIQPSRRYLVMLYACGSNGNGQLGVEHSEDLAEWTPVPLDLAGGISLAGGGNHTVIVAHNTGTAYITQNAQFEIVRHPEDQKWQLCAAGWDFSYFVDSLNKIWLLKDDNLRKMPWKLPPIQKIVCGMKHTAVLCENAVAAWGASRKGQCGVVSADVTEPFLKAIEGASDIACGRDYTVIVHPEILIWGASRFTNLPRHARKVLSGWSHIMLDGRMYGTNFHNQLAAPISEFDSAALGSEHGICVRDGTVYTWGWGEHGNCPPPAHFEGTIRVFGGCATSFVHVDI